MATVPTMSQDTAHPSRVGARIVEAVIIAVVSSALTAAAASALVITAIRVEVEQVKAQVGELKTEVRDMRGVIYRPSWERDMHSRVRAVPVQPEEP